MYQYYRLLTLTLNTSGGTGEIIEKLTKEVEGKVVACNEAEALVKMYNTLSSTGGNKATQSIKCILYNPNGEIVKIDEIIKTTE